MGGARPLTRGRVAKGGRARARAPSDRRKPVRKSMALDPKRAADSSTIAPEVRHEMYINPKHLEVTPPKGRKHIYDGVTIRHSDGSVGFIYPASRIPGVTYFWAPKGSSVALPMVSPGTMQGVLPGGHVPESKGIPVDQLPKIRRICHWAKTEHLRLDSNNPGLPSSHGFDHAAPRKVVDLPYFYNSNGSPATMGIPYKSSFHGQRAKSARNAEPATNASPMLPAIANYGGASGTTSRSPSLVRGQEGAISSTYAAANIMQYNGSPNNAFNEQEMYPSHVNSSRARGHRFGSACGQDAHSDVMVKDGAGTRSPTGNACIHGASSGLREASNDEKDVSERIEVLDTIPAQEEEAVNVDGKTYANNSLQDINKAFGEFPFSVFDQAQTHEINFGATDMFLLDDTAQIGDSFLIDDNIEGSLMLPNVTPESNEHSL